MWKACQISHFYLEKKNTGIECNSPRTYFVFYSQWELPQGGNRKCYLLQWRCAKRNIISNIIVNVYLCLVYIFVTAFLLTLFLQNKKILCGQETNQYFIKNFLTILQTTKDSILEKSNRATYPTGNQVRYYEPYYDSLMSAGSGKLTKTIIRSIIGFPDQERARKPEQDHNKELVF